MKLLSQQDPAWANVKMGESNETLAKSGCTTTDISMLSSWYADMGFGCYRSPDWLAKNLRYTKDGYLYWQSITEKMGFAFDWRFYTYDEMRILPALSGKLSSCLLRLYDGSKAHWVVGIRKIGNYYYVANPYPLPSGRREFIHKSVISGGATFIVG